MTLYTPAGRRLSHPEGLPHGKCSRAIRGWLSVYLLYRWEGKNENEVGRCKETGKVHVTVDLKYYRPTEVVRTPWPPRAWPHLAGWLGRYSHWILTASLQSFPLDSLTSFSEQFPNQNTVNWVWDVILTNPLLYKGRQILTDEWMNTKVFCIKKMTYGRLEHNIFLS